jgi:hypothetical protein
VKGNSNIRQFYHDHAGFLPQNWKTRPEVISRLGGPIKDLKALGAALGAADANSSNVAAATTPEPVKQQEPEKKKKDAMPHHLGNAKAAEKEADRVAKPPSPVLSDDDIRLVQEFMKAGVVVGHKTTGGQSVPDPTKLNEVEAPAPSFSEQVGMESMEPTFSWSLSALIQLGEKSPTALAILAAQWRSFYLKTRVSNSTETEKKEEAKPVQQTAQHKSKMVLPTFNKKTA